VNSYDNIHLGVPKGLFKLYNFLEGLSREYDSFFTNEEIVIKNLAGVPALCRAFRLPAMRVSLEAEHLRNK